MKTYIPKHASLEGGDLYPLPTIESVFVGKSGCRITIQRWGVDDYSAEWDESSSVRGTLAQILEEIKTEI